MWRAAARALLESMPEEALRDLGVRKLARAPLATPVTLSLVAGAAVGIGLVLAFAPGSPEMRRVIASRLRHTRDLLVDAEVDLEDKLAHAGERLTAIVSGQRGRSDGAPEVSNGGAAG
jgi:hypothetical protein